MGWFLSHLPEVASLMLAHTALAVAPLILGLVFALPLGWVARNHGWTYPPLITITGLLYTVPSLALFILMPIFLGTGILDPINVIVTMTLYTVALLTRTVADGLAAVPEPVTQAATAMGIKPMRRFFTVELPLAIPVISAGLRVAAVSNVSIVSVAALLGIPQLGSLFTDGFARQFLDPIIVGVLSCLLLALILDLMILAVTRLATPWLGSARRTPAKEGAAA